MYKENKDDTLITLQITLFDKEGRYKPVSTLIKVKSIKYYKEHKSEVNQQAMIKICQKRGWTGKQLKEYGYTTLKVRNYDLVKKMSKEGE